MDRREFLTLAGMAPLGMGATLAQGLDSGRSDAAEAGKFELLEVTGSYRAIGEQVGRVFRRQIRTIIERRQEWHDTLLERIDSPAGRKLSEVLHEQAKKHFPHLLEELEGLAQGAGVAYQALWVITINSELRGAGADPAGCSTLVVDGRWLFHNEDFSSPYDGLMFALRVTPPSGVRFFCLTYPGIISGNGPSFNERGVVETTNYISCTRSQPGLPRYIVGRAILEAAGLDEAIEIATMAPRAHPYHFNLASLAEHRYASVEVSPETVRVHEPTDVYAHTNHLVLPGVRGWPGEDPEFARTSSVPRYESLVVGGRELTRGELTEETCLALMSSHRWAPHSLCRHPQGSTRGQTLATAFVDLERGRFRLFKGNPCESVAGGRFQDYSF